MLEHVLPTSCRDRFSSSQMIDPMKTFRCIRHVWLVDGEPSLFNYIYKLLDYGMSSGNDSRVRDRVR